MGDYFSEDLYALIKGQITAAMFRKLWGSKVEYDEVDATISVGDNIIITNGNEPASDDDDRTEITKKLTDLVKEYGRRNCKGEYELYTFDICSDNGVELAGCTIDKVETEHGGHIRLYYNENTGDYDYASEFSSDDLSEFYNGILIGLYDER